MRVIAGRLGGRRLRSPSGRSIRPTSDRVREALFSVLGDQVQGAAVLDLWAGTGALAIEAISRGAARATCVDRSAAALSAIRENVRTLGIDGEVEVVRDDALRYARRRAGGEEGFDLVFCDPPYDDPLEAIGAELIAGELWRRALVLEHAATREPPAPPPGATLETRRYGDTAVSLYRRS